MQGGIVLKVIDLRLRNTPRASSLTHNPANSHDFTLIMIELIFYQNILYNRIYNSLRLIQGSAFVQVFANVEEREFRKLGSVVIRGEWQVLMPL